MNILLLISLKGFNRIFCFIIGTKFETKFNGIKLFIYLSVTHRNCLNFSKTFCYLFKILFWCNRLKIIINNPPANLKYEIIMYTRQFLDIKN